MTASGCVLNNVFFDFDKATLKPESYPELNRLVMFLNNNAGVNVQIAGHTDSVGPEPYNLDLSKRRANSVVQYLYDKGVTKEKVKTVFFGETKPIDTNATREGRQKNRRVEFKIVNL
jgi:outer membrane protein OmpA-like peptidoglycan-associated protein